jgi:hypothetical protein
VGKALGVVIGLAVVACLLWVGGEMHYRNCVDTAKAAPDTRSRAERQLDSFEGGDSHAEAVQEQIRGCSRLPW